MTVNLTDEFDPTGRGKPHLSVISGARTELEHAALDAVFTNPARVPLLMARLGPRRGLLTQVHVAPPAPGELIKPFPEK